VRILPTTTPRPPWQTNELSSQRTDHLSTALDPVAENGKLYFVLPADAQQNQSNKIRNYLISFSRSSAVVSPTLYEKSLLAAALSRNMIEKRTQKKFHK
jgi:hypothetical protein